MSDVFEELRTLILDHDFKRFEELVCELLGRLVGLEFIRARGGSQHGGDGGTHGVEGHRLIYEARRYGPDTSFDNLSIRGEIDEAVQRAPDLEAWILVSTRGIPEQTIITMESAATPRGIQAIALDWLPTRMPRLAALCASFPIDVERVLGSDCGSLLSEIRESTDYSVTLEALKASITEALTGFEQLRGRSHARVREVWANADVAKSAFGQDVAGGALGKAHIRRESPTTDLDEWQSRASETRNNLAIVKGREGMGKTWAAVDWLQYRLDQLPIVVLVPSKVFVDPVMDRQSLFTFIARCLRDLVDEIKRSQIYWEVRVQRLFAKSVEIRETMLLFFDGLNERGGYDWLSAFDTLQATQFNGRMRVLVSARTSFVEERLGNLRWHDRDPIHICVQSYDEKPGGEFERKLRVTGIERKDLSSALVDLARVPRLFQLVIKLKDRFGNVNRVTLNRLFWEYGATAIRQNPFSPREWREFVIQSANEFKAGKKRQFRGSVEERVSKPTATQDENYQKVSSIVDGVFAELNDWGEVEFNEDFVRYSLGLALVKKLHTENKSSAKESLRIFFDPVNEHDEEAEIVRAAVSITLAMQPEGKSPFLAALCERWVRCQNLPRDHLDELNLLAQDLVDPLLDVIEVLGSHAESMARYRAINALNHGDLQDVTITQKIAARGTQWLKLISQRLSKAGGDEASAQVLRRRERLDSRIGTGDTGVVKVLGREVEIVPWMDEGLFTVAAQLLQGRPLEYAIDFFETDAIRFAIDGEYNEAISWLNMLNEVDPSETASRLRASSQSFLQCQPENGVHEQLNKRVAAILLWRTWFEEDNIKAQEIDPGLDWKSSYYDDYGKSPATSWYHLERRHAISTLLRKDIPLRQRIDRTSEYLKDPSLEVPATFVDELVDEVRALDLKKLDTSVSKSSEDLDWNDLSWVLARCAPNELARVERERLCGFARRHGETRMHAARIAPNAMLMVENTESESLCEVRERIPDIPENYETWIRTELLIAEIQGRSGIDQLRTIVEADIQEVGSRLTTACESPQTTELEDLVDQYRHNPKALKRIAEVIGEKNVSLGDQTISTFLELLLGESDEKELELVWVLLGLNTPANLGVELDRRDWAWSETKSQFENVMGSYAIAAANREAPFESFAQRLSPVTLLEIVHNRKGSREEVILAAELVGKIIMQSHVDTSENFLEIFHDQSRASKTVNYLFGAGNIVEDTKDDFGQVLSPWEKDYEERRHKLGKRYRQNILSAWERGARFHFVPVHPKHLECVMDKCPEYVHRWVDGLEERTETFVNRVRSSELFFVSLCEMLLTKQGDLGVKLWWALRDCLTHVKFIIHGDRDRLLDALFSARASAAVNQALDHLYSLEFTNSDKDLIELIVAARRNDKLEWLRDKVASDSSSNCPVCRERAAFIEPLLETPEIAKSDEWSGGSLYRSVREQSWELAQCESFAKYWLRSFADSNSEVEAHAAWKMFLACVDRRVWSWFDEVLNHSQEAANRLDALKRRFVELQSNEIQRAITTNERQWRNKFTYRHRPGMLRPWFRSAN